jgi:DNA-binding NarL/FixJ family response regulator
MKILIVDDNPGVRDVVRSVVESIADDIRECDDGSKALEAYRHFRPDWVLMDIGMKNVDGITATSEIIEAFPDARVLMVTDYGDAFFQNAADEAGAYGFIGKEQLFELPRVISNPAEP